MRSTASWLLVLSVLALAGCSQTSGAGLVRPQLPDLPSQASGACKAPVARVGDDLGVLAARWKATAVCEGGKRASLIVFYRDLQKGLAGQ